MAATVPTVLAGGEEKGMVVEEVAAAVGEASGRCAGSGHGERIVTRMACHRLFYKKNWVARRDVDDGTFPFLCIFLRQMLGGGATTG